MLTAHTQAEKGFTLVEMMVAVAIAGIVFAAMVTAFNHQQRTFMLQDQLSQMIENARVAMDIMTREIRVTGYDPTGAEFVGIGWDCTANPRVLELRIDLNANGAYFGTNEWIKYRYNSAAKRIERQVGFGSFLPFIEDIDACTFEPLDGNGNATCVDADIRQVRLTITARTPKPDHSWPQNGGHRTLTLTSRIQPRNLADHMESP